MSELVNHLFHTNVSSDGDYGASNQDLAQQDTLDSLVP